MHCARQSSSPTRPVRASPRRAPARVSPSCCPTPAMTPERSPKPRRQRLTWSARSGPNCTTTWLGYWSAKVACERHSRWRRRRYVRSSGVVMCCGRRRPSTTVGSSSASSERSPSPTRQFDQAEQLYAQLGMSLGQLKTRNNRAWLASLRGDVVEALRLHDGLQRELAALGVPPGLFRLDHAAVLLAASLHTEALAAAEQAVVELEQEGMQLDCAEALLLASLAARLAGAFDTAERLGRTAVEAFIEQQRPAWALRAQHVLVEVAWSTRRYDDSTEQLARSIANELDDAGWCEWAREVHLLVGQMALERGDLDEASSRLRLGRAGGRTRWQRGGRCRRVAGSCALRSWRLRQRATGSEAGASMPRGARGGARRDRPTRTCGEAGCRAGRSRASVGGVFRSGPTHPCMGRATASGQPPTRTRATSARSRPGETARGSPSRDLPRRADRTLSGLPQRTDSHPAPEGGLARGTDPRPVPYDRRSGRGDLACVARHGRACRRSRHAGACRTARRRRSALRGDRRRWQVHVPTTGGDPGCADRIGLHAVRPRTGGDGSEQTGTRSSRDELGPTR